MPLLSHVKATENFKEKNKKSAVHTMDSFEGKSCLMTNNKNTCNIVERDRKDTCMIRNCL